MNNINEDELRKSVGADINQYLIDSLIPDRGYLTPIDNVRALIVKAGGKVVSEKPRKKKSRSAHAGGTAPNR